jgi:hypothetical protein
MMVWVFGGYFLAELNIKGVEGLFFLLGSKDAIPKSNNQTNSLQLFGDPFWWLYTRLLVSQINSSVEKQNMFWSFAPPIHT